MYLRFPKRLHLELTDACNAKCPMCKRNDAYTLEETSLVKNISLDYDLLVKTFGEKQFDQVKLCGNNGEPFANKEVFKIIEYFSPRTKVITANTNGSLRSESFWAKAGKIPNLEVVWGIDGITQESHHLYRVNTNLEKILKNAKAFIDAGGNAIWNMIVFKHNEDEVESAKKLSEEIGFAEFKFVHTRRFYRSDTHKYIWNDKEYTLEKSSQTETQPIKFYENKTYDKIVCQGESTEEIYIEATGEVWPCCYITKDNEIARNASDYNIRNKPIEDIVNSLYFDEVKNSFTNKPMKLCELTCGHNLRNLRITK